MGFIWGENKGMENKISTLAGPVSVPSDGGKIKKKEDMTPNILILLVHTNKACNYISMLNDNTPSVLSQVDGSGGSQSAGIGNSFKEGVTMDNELIDHILSEESSGIYIGLSDLAI